MVEQSRCIRSGAWESVVLRHEHPQIETGFSLRHVHLSIRQLSAASGHLNDPQMARTYLHEVRHGGAVALHQVGGVEASVRIPAHGQLLLGELEQVVQGLVVDLAVAGPAQNSNLQLKPA